MVNWNRDVLPQSNCTEWEGDSLGKKKTLAALEVVTVGSFGGLVYPPAWEMLAFLSAKVEILATREKEWRKDLGLRDVYNVARVGNRPCTPHGLYTNPLRASHPSWGPPPFSAANISQPVDL